jgi:hypothetical protein
MKEIRCTVWQKLITLICSIAIGGAYTSDANDKLVPETVAPRISHKPFVWNAKNITL